MKRAHPRPEAIALDACRAAGPCGCDMRARRAFLEPGERIDRRLCEPRYRDAVRTILRRLFGDLA